MSITPLFYIALSSYLLWRLLEKIGISYILHCCGSWYCLLCHWEKTYTTVFTFLMANKVWEILIPQICIDFHNWENHTCTRKLLLISFRYVLLKKCLQLRKNINYKQGWGYSKLRCSPEHSQPKDMGIFCLLGWLQMIELLFQTLYSCYLLASVSGLLILLNVLF